MIQVPVKPEMTPKYLCYCIKADFETSRLGGGSGIQGYEQADKEVNKSDKGGDVTSLTRPRAFMYEEVEKHYKLAIQLAGLNSWQTTGTAPKI